MNWLRVLALAALFLLDLPIALIVYEGAGPLNTAAGYSLEALRSIELTIVSSVLAVAVCVSLFTPLAYYLARYGSRISESLADIPASVPHPIIGVALLILDSPLTPTGRFLLSIGVNFFGTLTGLVAALSVVAAPIYIKAMQTHFEGAGTPNEEYALGLGASRARVFFSVALPGSTGAIVTASMIAMSRAMSEFGSLAIIAYSVLQFPFYGVSPAPVLVYQYYSFYGLGAAVTLSSVLILLSLPLGLTVRLFQRRKKEGERWV
jgi:molybdate/tungstate transport system permease protein